jgi:hypothetical protein
MKRRSSNFPDSGGPGGFTLLEVLVASGLAAVAFFLLISLLVRVSGVTNKISAITEIQQTSQMALSRLEALLQRCDVGGIKILQDVDICALSLHPIGEVTPTSAKLYAPRISVLAWTPASGALLEFQSDEQALEDRWQPIRLGGDQMRDLTKQRPVRTLCTAVSKMEIVGTVFPVLLKLDLSRNAPGYGWQRVHLERYLSLRVQY